MPPIIEMTIDAVPPAPAGPATMPTPTRVTQRAPAQPPTITSLRGFTRHPAQWRDAPTPKLTDFKMRSGTSEAQLPYVGTDQFESGGSSQNTQTADVPAPFDFSSVELPTQNADRMSILFRKRGVAVEERSNVLPDQAIKYADSVTKGEKRQSSSGVPRKLKLKRPNEIEQLTPQVRRREGAATDVPRKMLREMVAEPIPNVRPELKQARDAKKKRPAVSLREMPRIYVPNTYQPPQAYSKSAVDKSRTRGAVLSRLQRERIARDVLLAADRREREERGDGGGGLEIDLSPQKSRSNPRGQKKEGPPDKPRPKKRDRDQDDPGRPKRRKR